MSIRVALVAILWRCGAGGVTEGSRELVFASNCSNGSYNRNQWTKCQWRDHDCSFCDAVLMLSENRWDVDSGTFCVLQERLRSSSVHVSLNDPCFPKLSNWPVPVAAPPCLGNGELGPDFQIGMVSSSYLTRTWRPARQEPATEPHCGCSEL